MFTLALPLAILQPPFFHPEAPEALNYGALGSAIGHELTHHFDDQGASYGPRGNLVVSGEGPGSGWFSAETKRRFRERADCFVEQYGSIETEEEVGGHRRRLNGSSTLGENISDNGGLRAATLAFQKVVASGPPVEADYRLPQLETTTPEQLFFLAYAGNWCSAYRAEALARHLAHNPHLPGVYRTNVSLANSEAFARAFSCPPGSPMNPPRKCRLW